MDQKMGSMPFRQQFNDKLTWYGAIFGAVYVALYARYSAQWRYLAGLYNVIKASEISITASQNAAMDQWKAGFIEDAEILHLAKKESFASIIRIWCESETVKEQYRKTVPGGETRLESLLEEVNKSFEKVDKSMTKKI